jgi:hypothetical protein
MSQTEIQTDTPQKFTESFERYLAGVTEVEDLARMESWLDDELRCEVDTKTHIEVGGCSGEVTHIGTMRCVQQSRFMCQRSASARMEQAACGHRCIYKHSASECWKIIPI